MNQWIGHNDAGAGFVLAVFGSSLRKGGIYVLSLFLSFSLAGGYSASVAAAESTWEAVSASQVQIELANPKRNQRSKEATVDISLKNISGADIPGPLRLIIGGLNPAAKVSIGNATGQTGAGEPYYDLTGYIGTDLAVGGSGLVTVNIKGEGSFGLINAIVKGGHPNAFNFTPRIERQVSHVQPLTIHITSPATLLTVGSTPQTVKGTVSDPQAQVTLNGNPVTNDHGHFQAEVALDEGHNTLTARAVNDKGEDVSDVISLSLDMTPPYITVESPKDGDTVRINKIAVSGLINDIVRGTVAEGQASVKVNGILATVANRSYLAEEVALNEGENIIKIDASDNVGNTASLSIKVTYQPLAPQHIELLNGQSQSAKIGTVLTQPLKVKLLDTKGKPVANKPVIYRVIEGDGDVGAGSPDQGQGVLVPTDAEGVAATSFKLGSRAGTGNQRVRAASVGFDGEVLFYASATVGDGNKVTVNAGNNQRGAVGQPLPQPFVVAVVDEGANVVPGAQIEFKVTQGSGKFQNGQTSLISTTDSDGRATAELTLGEEEGLDVQRATATLVGTPLYAGFSASALKTGDPGQTRISGVVLDNQDQPLPGVTVRVDGTTREAQTDAQGQFKITEAPVGSVHLIADGSTTTAEGEYPTLAFNLVTIAGAENPLSAPIYLVKLDTVNAQTVGDKDVTLTLPEVPGFALDVKAGSVTFPDGKKTGRLSVTPVNAAKIPMSPPNGMQPQFIVTIQPVGAKFDPPARLSLPNVDGHKPGAQVEMFSYDHDLEEFVAIGLGTVSTDGSVIKSNQGVGVIKAGWHCGSQPGGSGCAATPGECQKCDGNCVIVPDDTQKPTKSDSDGDCKRPECEGGKVVQKPDDSDLPENVCESCSKGEIADAPNGKECKEGQPCWTCTDGSCKRKGCEPSSHGEVKEFTAENSLERWKGYINKALEYLPIPLQDISVDEQFFGTKKEGEECCVDCKKPQEPQAYTEYAGGARINIQGLIGQKKEINIIKSTFFKTYEVTVGGKVNIGGKVELRPSANVTGKINLGCEDICVTASGGAELRVTPIGAIKVEGVVAENGLPVAKSSGAGEAGLRMSGGLNAFVAVGQTCTDADLCKYNYGSGIAYYQWKIEFLIPFLFDFEKYTETGRDEFVWWEGKSGSCS